MSAIRLWNGDICDLEVEAIVVPAITTLWMTSGPAAAVKQRGGHGIEFEAVAHGPQPLGSVIVTRAGSLPSQYVFHAVTLGPGRRTSAAAVDEATRGALRQAERLGLASIALPALGSPLGGVSLPVSAAASLRALVETLPECRGLQEVVLALRSPRTYAVFRAALEEETGREPNARRDGPLAPPAPGGARPWRGIPVAPDLERNPLGVMAEHAHSTSPWGRAGGGRQAGDRP